MFGLTLLGAVHTAFAVVALVAARRASRAQRDEAYDAIAIREVSPLVNRVANNGPELLAPV